MLSFYPLTKIIASVGKDILEASPKFAYSLLPVIHNVRVALVNDLEVCEISVSTTFAFADVITMPFPPSTTKLDRYPTRSSISKRDEFSVLY